MVAGMKKTVLGSVLVIGLGLASAFQFREEKMQEIRFTLGKNIVATAKATGVPQFNVDNVDGSIQYSASQIPLTTPVVYDYPGYEIRIQPTFSLTLDADHTRSPSDLVHRVSVSIPGKHVKSHAAGRALAENLIAQFNNGRWKRYISPTCPSVTGRSSYLDETGDITSSNCAIDPHHKFTADDWLKLFSQTRDFAWIGEGVLANLRIGYSDDTRGITYGIRVTFDDYKTMLATDAEIEARDNKTGDEKGWNTSAQAAEGEKVRLLGLRFWKKMLLRGVTP